MKPHIAIIACLLLRLAATPAPCAEYNGKHIDGEVYDCTAYSQDTMNYYNVTVEFDSDQATLRFPNGGSVVLTLDSDEIDDPSSTSAYDPWHLTHWDLEVNDLED